MKRQEKYPETSTFHYHNANPYNRITTDCVIRAESVALGIPYEQVVLENAQLQCKTGFSGDNAKGVAKYMELKGWNKHPQPRKDDGTKYTVREFCQRLAKPGERYVVSMAGHLVAVVDCKAWDIWDCTDVLLTKCVGNYWKPRTNERFS